MYDFDAVIDRRGTASFKWDKYQGRDILPLWVADMDFRSPPCVIEALHERVSHGVFGYGHAPDELEEAVRASLAAEYAWQTSREWMVWLPGLVSGLNVACRAVGCPGDEVLTFTPVYPPFLSAPVLADRSVVRVPLVQTADRWEIDWDATEDAITPRCRLLMLCGPHNPVGRVWLREDLSRLAEIAQRHDLVVCSDEIHAGLVLDENKAHVPMAALAPEIAARTITLMAPSKTFNTPGLGCSFAIISDPVLRAGFVRAMEGIVPHVNVLGYVAAQAAYEKGEDWREALLAYLRANRDVVEQEIASMPGLRMTHVEATYLAWIDARDCGSDNPVALFEEAGVGLSDGAEFDGAGFVRLNFGCSRTVLQEALRRIRTALTR